MLRDRCLSQPKSSYEMAYASWLRADDHQYLDARGLAEPVKQRGDFDFSGWFWISIHIFFIIMVIKRIMSTATKTIYRNIFIPDWMARRFPWNASEISVCGENPHLAQSISALPRR